MISSSTAETGLQDMCSAPCPYTTVGIAATCNETVKTTIHERALHIIQVASKLFCFTKMYTERLPTGSSHLRSVDTQLQGAIATNAKKANFVQHRLMLSCSNRSRRQRSFYETVRSVAPNPSALTDSWGGLPVSAQLDVQHEDTHTLTAECRMPHPPWTSASSENLPRSSHHRKAWLSGPDLAQPAPCALPPRSPILPRMTRSSESPSQQR